MKRINHEKLEITNVEAEEYMRFKEIELSLIENWQRNREAKDVSENYQTTPSMEAHDIYPLSTSSDPGRPPSEDTIKEQPKEPPAEKPTCKQCEKYDHCDMVKIVEVNNKVTCSGFVPMKEQPSPPETEAVGGELW
jgi:hypothetical protein